MSIEVENYFSSRILALRNQLKIVEDVCDKYGQGERSKYETTVCYTYFVVFCRVFLNMFVFRYCWDICL